MKSQSGCFGFDLSDPIDDPREAEQVVDDIVATNEEAEEAASEIQPMLVVLSEYLKRVRILTWAVVAIVIVMIMREVKD